MAIYHCSVQIIGRSSGRSAVAAAAYRSGEDIVSAYDGIEHDFTKKNWINYSEIMLPKNAPESYKDRSVLWNAVELIEKSSNAQLAREFELSIPKEFTKEQQIEVVRQFARENLTSQGMVADIAIHSPPVTNDRHQPIDINGNATKDIAKMQFINPHAHIMVTVRPIDDQGRWEHKSEKEYICKRGDEEKAFTASEYKKEKAKGWEKQYRFIDGKKKIWLTAEKGRQRDLERINRAPKTTPYGRKNEIIERWNSKDRIFEWRQHWETVVNDKFASLRSDVRIDCRSFKDQGRTDEIPTMHMGTAATNMEKRAYREISEGRKESDVVRSDIGDINRLIRRHNNFVRQLKIKLDNMAKKAGELIDGVIRAMEGIRAKIIGNQYEETILLRDCRSISSRINAAKERLDKYKTETEKSKKANASSVAEIKHLRSELNGCAPYQIGRKKDLQNKIQEEQAKIEIRNDYMTAISKRYGYPDRDAYLEERQAYNKAHAELKSLERNIKSLQDETVQYISDYAEEAKKNDVNGKEDFSEKRKSVRSEMEVMIKDELQKSHGDAFDESAFSRAIDMTDTVLSEKHKDDLTQVRTCHLHRHY